MLDLAALVFAAGSAVGIAAFASTDPIVVHKSTVPALVEARGYNGKTVAKLLRNRIRDIARAAGTARGDDLGVFHADESAIDQLAERLHLDGLIDSLRELLDLHRYSIDLTLVNASQQLQFSLPQGLANGALVTAGADELKLILKGESANDALFTLYVSGSNSVPELIDKMAMRFIERVDPYVLTLYHFRKEYASGEFNETLPLIEHTVRVLPIDQVQWPLLLWGRAHFRQGDYDAAIARYRQALQLNPHFAFAQARWGEALVAKGEVRVGIEKIEAALQQVLNQREQPRPRRYATAVVLYQLLGDVQMQQGDHSAARAAYIAGLDLLPDSPILQTSLGRLYLLHGQHRVAAELLSKAVGRHPNPQQPQQLLDEAMHKLLQQGDGVASL